MQNRIISLIPISLINLVFLFNPALRLENKAVVTWQTDSLRQNDEPKCSDCHLDLITKKTVHPPASESCENCHTVKIKEHTDGNGKGLGLSDNVPGLCYTCHDGIKNFLDTVKFVHQAVKSVKSCTGCHSPHSSDEKKLLVSDEKKMCLACHNRDVNETGRKVLNMDKLLTNSKVIHPVLESDGCIVCHNPHGSTNTNMLKDAFPTGKYAPLRKEVYGLCWQCHDSEMLTAQTTSATNFRNGNKNLHTVHSFEKSGRTCTMCHNVHAAPNEHLIENKVQFGEWEMPLKYAPRQNGGSCFPGCHSGKSYTR